MAVPVLKSITTADYYTKDPNQVAIVEKWIPVCKTFAATEDAVLRRPGRGGRRPGTGRSSPRRCCRAQTDAKAALTTLQQGLEAVVK